MQGEVKVFQGLSRATHPIKQSNNLLWDAHNIRLTTRDGESMLSITNERSTKEILSFKKDEKYVGHVVLGNYLVVLVHSNEDTIYRIDLNSMLKAILYRGNLNLDPSNPAQMIADYESELIQKVYWVDGINSPRVINIAKPELLEVSDTTSGMNYSNIYTDAPFNFVQELELNEEVSVDKLQSNIGIFPSGVIQYALTYLHKYGQESNIFYVSEPLYLSYADRGGSPEDRVSNSFRITVKNVDKKFQFVRVYSIIRTSIDSTPLVKRVTDIDITKSGKDQSGQIDVSVVDNNTTGDNVDPTYLLYVGGKDITAKCIESKDNTLFLGNISYNRKSVRDLNIRDDNFKLNPSINNLHIEDREIELPSKDTEYIYANQLAKNTLTFKNGETYRLGCRFQYKSGEWSEPIWVKDEVYNYSNLGYNNSALHLGQIVGELPSVLKDKLLREGYKRVQALICQPSYKDRTILAQGIVCPTVGNVGNRATKSGVWAQSSWLLRPWSSYPEGDGYSGALPACRHNYSLAFGNNRCVELQTMALAPGMNTGTYIKPYGELILGADGQPSAYYGTYIVDQSIVTMHSPDIEFGNIESIVNAGTSLKLYDVGTVLFSTNKGNIDVQTSSPVINPDAAGFIRRSLKGDGARSLVSGLFYEDSWVEDWVDDQHIDKEYPPRMWMTYLWHRSGSLNNDIVRPEGKGTRSAVLKKKTISNLKISNSTAYHEPSKLNLLDCKVFNSSDLALSKLNAGSLGTISYYGNVDTLVPAYSRYDLITTYTRGGEYLYPSTIPLSGSAIVLGENKSFKITAKSLLGSDTHVTSSNIEGEMPYIIDKDTVIESNVSASSEDSTEENPDGTINTNRGRYSADSKTTITSTNTKTVMIDVTGKATVAITLSSDSRRKCIFYGVVTLTQDIVIDEKNTIKAGFTWDIQGNTNYKVTSKSASKLNAAVDFSAATYAINDGIIVGSNLLGNVYDGFKLSKEGVRLKYKSSPHAVLSLSNALNNSGLGTLHLVELRQNVDESLRYGGTTEEALRSNLWIPAGPSLRIDEGIIKWVWGDTWYQRYDCLKTYPFTFEDINQVTEIGSFYCETRVNIDGRYDRNRGDASFSVSPVNFNLINPVYSQLDNFFTSRMLDEDYYKVTDYPSQFLWTGVKNPSAEMDIWTNLHMANSYDMDGSNGQLNAIQSFNEVLLGFQDRAVSQILFNSRVQIQASDGVPIEIANSQKVEGVRAYSNVIGCQDKFNIVSSTYGLYFIDNNNSTVYRFDGSLNNIGNQLGNLFWFRDNYQDNRWMFKSDKEGNPGIRLFYDPKYQDVYFVPSLTINGEDRDNTHDALCFSEQLNQFTSMMSYNGAVMFPYESKFYSLANNPDGVLTLWENFAGSSYNYIYKIYRPFSFSFISNENPTVTKIFDTVEMRTDRYNDELLGDIYSTNIQTGQPLDFIRVNNEYQDTHEIPFDAYNFRKKFRIWRATIPRNFGTRERVRNLWSKITLGCNKPNTNLTILHDLSVHYTV